MINYEELYKKGPAEIIDYVMANIANVIANTEVSGYMLDKLSEWRYVLGKAELELQKK